MLNSSAYWCDFDIFEQVSAGAMENLHELAEVIEALNTPAKNRNRALFNTFCALDRSDSTNRGLQRAVTALDRACARRF